MKCLLILLVVVHLGNCADEVINYDGDYNYDEEVPNKRYKKSINFLVWFMSFRKGRMTNLVLNVCFDFFRRNENQIWK